MWRGLWRLFAISIVIAVTIYALLLMGERFFPQFYPTPVQPWLLVFLVAVGFVPRLIGWAIDLIPPRSPKRRRKT